MNSLEAKLRREEELDKIKEALDQGTISKQEYDAILAHDYGIVEEQTARWPVVAAAFVILGVFGLFTMWGGTITGQVVAPTEQVLLSGVYENSTTVPANVSDVMRVSASGTIQNGAATIYAQTHNETLLIANVKATKPALWLENEQYTPEENITVETTLQNYTLWIVDNSGNRTPVQEPFTMEQGQYTLEALTNESKESISFTVGNESEKRELTTTFTDTCEDTCNITTNITDIIITVNENATLNLTEILIVRLEENKPPQQIAEIPTIAVNGTTTIDLSVYFNDTDELTYEINNIIGIEEQIDGSELTLTSNNPGEYEATIYVSDLKAVTTAKFNITVLGEIEETNETINETTNQTVNETNNEQTQTNTTTNTSNDTTTQTSTQTSCDNPNVNLRPPECFGEQFDLAFEEIEAPLRNNNLERVARVTRFGNFVVRGQYIEESTAEPSQEDFTVGYTTSEGFRESYQATAWIDTNTGDLHLRGKLHQEQGALQAPQYDSFVISNPNGIILAYFDERTGDLYLKGNIVQLGRP